MPLRSAPLARRAVTVLPKRRVDEVPRRITRTAPRVPSHATNAPGSPPAAAISPLPAAGPITR